MYSEIMSACTIGEARQFFNDTATTEIYTKDLTTALHDISELYCFYLERWEQLEMFDLPLAEEDLGQPVKEWLN